MNGQTSYACTVCGARVLYAESLTDYHVAAAVSRTDGRNGNAPRVPCHTCNGTGRIFARIPGSAEPWNIHCEYCDGTGRVSACDDSRRVCKPCARHAFHILLRAACVRAVL